ncbi:hypothetical protein BDZ89DRAFT_1149853 [Hymenopellis radicata]|nr:hypothetical protein BDZ89DRAFT_1149853 [Hymenopellis radicata]
MSDFPGGILPGSPNDPPAQNNLGANSRLGSPFSLDQQFNPATPTPSLNPMRRPPPSRFNVENINPVFRQRQNTPAPQSQPVPMSTAALLLQARERMRRQQADASAPIPESTTPSSPFSTDSAGTSPGATISTSQERDNMPNSFAVASQKRSRVDLGKEIVKRQKLGVEAERDFMKYCEMESPVERELVSVALLYDIRSQLQKAHKQKDKMWKLPEGLKKDSSLFMKALICSPFASGYTDTAKQVIMQALRESGRKSVPSLEETDKCRIMLRATGRKWSQYRNQVKTKIQKSIKAKKTRNIAHLAKDIIGDDSDSIPITLALYHRLAFLQYHVEQNYTEKQHWIQALSELKQNAASDEEFVTITHNMLHLIYEEDIKKYGDPTTTNVRVAEEKNAADWVTKMWALSAKIERKGGDDDKEDDNSEDEFDQEELGGGTGSGYYDDEDPQSSGPV